MQLSLVCTALAIEPPGIEHYPLTHAPTPQQPSGPPHPGHEPPSGIEDGGPDFDVYDVHDPEMFRQPDLSTYGAGIAPATGWWLNWDYLRWTVSVPHKQIIGNPYVQNQYTVPTTFTNLGQYATIDTGFLNNGPSNGYRWEGGFQDEDFGFFFSAFRLYTNDQHLTSHPNVFMPFSAIPASNGVTQLQGFIDPNQLGFDADVNNNGTFGRYGTNPQAGVFVNTPPDFGDLVNLPVQFNFLTVQTKRNTWGAEANYQWRLPQGQKHTAWDLFIGPRYFKFDDQLFISGTGGILDAAWWNTRASNNLVGGQLGIRGRYQHGRLTVSTEGRFMAAADIQILSQLGQIANSAQPGGPATNPPTPLTLSPTGWSTQLRTTTWAPLGELRFDLYYQIFNKVSLNFGWTGLVVDGIARPNNITNYELPHLGILNKGQNRETVFMQGINFGVTFNR